MKKNLNAVITDFDGNEIIDQGKKLETSPLIVNALLTPREHDSGEQKVKDFNLAQKVHKKEEAEYSPEELSRIKELVGKIYAPLIVAKVFELADK